MPNLEPIYLLPQGHLIPLTQWAKERGLLVPL